MFKNHPSNYPKNNTLTRSQNLIGSSRKKKRVKDKTFCLNLGGKVCPFR